MGAGIAYEALMHHYVHYDEQMWDRTQLIIYVQGGAITATFFEGIANKLFGAYVMIVAILLTAAIWKLKSIDYYNSRVNQTTMDDISKIIGKNIPTKQPRLRAEGGVLRGHRILDIVFGLLLFFDLVLLVLNACEKLPPIRSF